MLIRCSSNLIFLSSLIKSQHSVILKPLQPALFPCSGELNVRHAGHSKWQNIRHTKAAKDRLKGITFNYYVHEMERVCRRKSIDPKVNNDLAKVIKEAGTVNMPAATINKVLKRLETRRKNPITTKFGYKGPNGLIILVTALSDNPSRTKLELNILTRKTKIHNLPGDPTSAFYAKGWVFAKPPPGVTNVADQSLEDAIEVDAEEVAPDEERPELLKFVCEGPELNKVKSKLETRKYEIEEAIEMFLPRGPVEIGEHEMEELTEIITQFEEVPEVEKVFVNIE